MVGRHEIIDRLPDLIPDYRYVRRTWNDALRKWSNTGDASQAPYVLTERSFGSYVRPERAVNVILLTGPNGVGKDSFIRLGFSLGFGGVMVRRDTTRRKRPGEVQDVDYHFTGKFRFVLNSLFGVYLFRTSHDRKGYDVCRGIRKKEFNRAIDTAHFAVLTGGPTTLEALPSIMRSYRVRDIRVGSVYMLPPSVDEWLTRLLVRSADDPVQISELPQRISDSLGMLGKLADGSLKADLITVNDDRNAILARTGRIVRAMTGSTY